MKTKNRRKTHFKLSTLQSAVNGSSLSHGHRARIRPGASSAKRPGYRLEILKSDKVVYTFDASIKHDTSKAARWIDRNLGLSLMKELKSRQRQKDKAEGVPIKGESSLAFCVKDSRGLTVNVVLGGGETLCLKNVAQIDVSTL